MADSTELWKVFALLKFELYPSTATILNRLNREVRMQVQSCGGRSKHGRLFWIPVCHPLSNTSEISTTCDSLSSPDMLFIHYKTHICVSCSKVRKQTFLWKSTPCLVQEISAITTFCYTFEPELCMYLYLFEYLRNIHFIIIHSWWMVTKVSEIVVRLILVSYLWAVT